MPNTYNYGQFDDDLLEALQSGYSGDDLNELFGDVNLSEWAGSNLAFDEAAGAEQLRIRNARIGGEQALRELKGERLFEQAGVPKSMMPRGRQSLQSVLGRLNSDNPDGVIGPFIEDGSGSKGANFQRRFHTREVESPFVKGRMEVRPFVNPETKGPLVSTFANANEFPVPGIKVDERWMNPDPKGDWYRPRKPLGANVGDHATELVTKYAAWLGGYPQTRQSNDIRPAQIQHASSFQEFKGLKDQLLGPDFNISGYPADAETVWSTQGGPRAQLNAVVFDTPGDIKSKVSSVMKDQNTDFFTALKMGENVPGGTGTQIPGKVMKDYFIFQPAYDPEFMRNNNSGPTFQRDKTTKAPKRVYAMSGAQIKQNIQKKGSNLDMNRISFPNNSYAEGDRSTRVYYDPPLDGVQAKDISGKGAVPQILDDLDYKVKPQPVAQTAATKVAELPPTALERMQAIDRESSRRTQTRSSAIPKGEVGAVNAGLVDGAGKGLIKGRLGGLTNVALNGASRETGKRLAKGDFVGAATEFGTNYGIGAAADLGIRKAGQAILKRLPAALARGAAGTASSGGWAAPMAAAYTAYEVADGAVEGFTGKGLSTRMEEASDDAVTSAYERKFNQPAPRGGFVPKDKPLVQEKEPRAPASLDSITSAVEALSEIAPEVKAKPAQITQATPQVDKPDAGNFVSQWTNKVRSWFK